MQMLHTTLTGIRLFKGAPGMVYDLANRAAQTGDSLLR